jgi:hypothetical protein
MGERISRIPLVALQVLGFLTKKGSGLRAGVPALQAARYQLDRLVMSRPVELLADRFALFKFIAAMPSAGSPRAAG